MCEIGGAGFATRDEIIAALAEIERIVLEDEAMNEAESRREPSDG